MGGAQRIQSIKKATACICGGFFVKELKSNRSRLLHQQQLTRLFDRAT